MPPECSTFKEPFQEQLSLVHEFFPPILILVILQRILKSFALHPFSKNAPTFLMKNPLRTANASFIVSSFVSPSFWIYENDSFSWRIVLMTMTIDREGWERGCVAPTKLETRCKNKDPFQSKNRLFAFFSSRLNKANFPRTLLSFPAFWRTRETPTSTPLKKRLFTKDDTQIRVNLAVDNNLLLLLLLLLLSLYKNCWNLCNYLSFNNEDVLPPGFWRMYVPLFFKYIPDFLPFFS